MRQLRPIALVTVAAIMLFGVGCSVVGSSSRDDARMRETLGRMYPGFKVLELKYDAYHDSYPFGGSYARYLYRLESETVRGFVLFGQFYLENAGGETGWGDRYSMFNGAEVSRRQLIDLERTWVKEFPDVEVEVGDDSLTGPLKEDLFVSMSVTANPKYVNVPRDEIWGLWGNRDATEGWRPATYFHLDSRTGRWTYLPDFAQPDWQSQ